MRPGRSKPTGLLREQPVFRREGDGARQRPALHGGLVRSGSTHLAKLELQMADQAAFLVILLVEGVGEDLDERAVRSGRLLCL